MNYLSDRINLLAESETLAMTRRSRELRAQGFDVINLSIGEPDFNTPEHVKEAAKEAIDQNFSHYTPVPGYPELRQAIARKLKRDNGLDYSFDQIVVSTGAKQSLANAILCLVNPGEEVLIPAPYWVSYKEIIKLAGAKGVFIEGGIQADFKVTPEQVEKAITPATKLFIFSSPCNPSGTVYTYEELEAFAAVFARHPQVFVISDEIYENINFTGIHHSIASFAAIFDRVIVINGLSKGFAMTGWRLGYMAANKDIAKACDKLQGQITSGACSITQRAAIIAMDLIRPKVMISNEWLTHLNTVATWPSACCGKFRAYASMFPMEHSIFSPKSLHILVNLPGTVLFYPVPTYATTCWIRLLWPLFRELHSDHLSASGFPMPPPKIACAKLSDG